MQGNESHRLPWAIVHAAHRTGHHRPGTPGVIRGRDHFGGIEEVPCPSVTVAHHRNTATNTTTHVREARAADRLCSAQAGQYPIKFDAADAVLRLKQDYSVGSEPAN